MITSLGNFMNATLETDILIITLDDNLTHTYCSKLEWEKDNAMPMGIGKLTMPYSESIEKYWSTYSGTVIIHANLNNHQKPTLKKKDKPLKESKKATSKITKEKEEKKNIIRIQNDAYNYSFIGKVHRFKQVGKTVEIYLEDLGWKFLQKVPNDFRKTFIAGQKLDDAFQAICEFMGVDFAYTLEGLSQYNFSTDGYSVEKDGTVIEDTPSILEEFNKSADEKIDEENLDKTQDEKMADVLKNDPTFESSGLIEYQQNQKKTEDAQKKLAKAGDEALNQLNTNQRNDELTNETALQEDTSKLEKYEEEFNEKIENLFKGNTLYDSNVSDPILNYNWITIQPKVATTNTSNAVGGAGATSNPNGDESESGDENGTDLTLTSSRARERNGWIDGQYYINGKIYLSKEYINSLSPEAARRKRTGAYGNHTYTDDTMQKLLWRSLGQTLR